jgi:hypothetical protein
MTTNFSGLKDRLAHTNQLYCSPHLARVLPLNWHPAGSTKLALELWESR